MSIGAILVLVALVAVIMGFRYLLRSAVNKGFDAVENAVNKKKNEKNAASGNEENLADRFK